MGCVKLNTNENFLETVDSMGGGGLLRDNTGSWLGGFLWRKDGGSPFIAEASTLREGLLFAWNKGYR